MHFDFERKLKTDQRFRSKVERLTRRFQVLSREVKFNPKASEEYQQVVRALLKTCEYNLALFAGYYFPKYFEGRPLSFGEFAPMLPIFNISYEGFTVIIAGRQISKSIGVSARQRMLAHVFRNYGSLYITPRADQVETYARKFRATEKAFRYPVRDTNAFKQNMYFKEYPNGNQIEMVYCLSSPDNARGKSYPEHIYDEYQDFDASFEIQIGETQKSFKNPMSLYLGTAKTTDSALQVKFDDSSQGRRVIRCPNGHFNVPTVEGRVMDMIQKDGLCCATCKAPMDVIHNASWEHDSPSMLNINQVGFHIPQIVIPFAVNNPSRWRHIYKLKNSPTGEKEFLQEILGISQEEGERELTVKNLQDICTLPDREQLETKARDRRYKFIISGCDWGGSEWSISDRTKVSYTFHVVMGVTHDGKFDIIYMHRYKGMLFKDIGESIVQIHNSLFAQFIGSDFGGGQYYNNHIRNFINPDKHLVFNYSSGLRKFIDRPGKDAADYMYNMFSFNKTESISVLFDAIRTKRIRCFPWIQASDYLSDCLNLIRYMHVSPTGKTYLGYRRHGSKPDDGLDAINYAFTVGRILLKESLLDDIGDRQALEASLTGRGPSSNSPLAPDYSSFSG